MCQCLQSSKLPAPLVVLIPIHSPFLLSSWVCGLWAVACVCGLRHLGASANNGQTTRHDNAHTHISTHTHPGTQAHRHTQCTHAHTHHYLCSQSSHYSPDRAKIKVIRLAKSKAQMKFAIILNAHL